VIADRQAHAVIPPRKNAKPWKDKKMGSLERNELLRTVKYFMNYLEEMVRLSSAKFG
ncbi:hypothetical protein J455_3027, partial [Acinetobacter baumannii 17534]